MNPGALLSILQLVKAAIVCFAILLILGYWLHRRLYGTRGRWPLDAALVVLAAISVGAYFDFGEYPKFRTFMNPHDVYHYYLGSKYSHEVGYLHLYQCTVVADWELSGKPNPPRMTAARRMDNYAFDQGTQIVRDADKYRGMFTPERWEEFKKDCRYFAGFLQKNRWTGVVQDMGYNATPVWNMIARVLTNHIPTDSAAGMRFLESLDLVLIAVMAALVSWAFGWRIGVLALIFFCTCFCMSYTHIRGGFLRLDWVTMLVMSLSLIKKARYKTAGVLMGYAGMARIFPCVFVFGLGGKFLWDIVRTWKLNRNYIAFFVVFALVCAVLMSLSVWSDGGVEHWKAFSKKIALHNSHLAPSRVGFRNIFLMAYEYPEGGWPAYRNQARQTLENRKFLLWAIQGTIVIAALFAVRKVDDYETIPLGYVLAFFLTAPTFYYHVMLIAALFLFLPKFERVSRLVGTLGMFLSSVILFVVTRYWALDLKFAFAMACVLSAIVAYMMATAYMARPELLPVHEAIAEEAGSAIAEAERGTKRRRKRR